MIEIRPMDERYLHLTCLHDGPMDTATVERAPQANGLDLPPRPWSDETLVKLKAEHLDDFGHFRPVELMREMMDRYGTCAILAWEGQKVVGHIRFYPMEVARLLWTSDPCPVLKCTGACDPEEDEGTLWVLCVMTCRPYVGASSCNALAAVSPTESGPVVSTTSSGELCFRTIEEAGARQGVGLKLVQGLISWATEHGWKRIVKVAHCDLDWHYGVLGGGGKAFWTKAGFRVVDSYIDRAWEFNEDDWAIVQAQMAEAGMTAEEVWTWYRMAYEL